MAPNMLYIHLFTYHWLFLNSDFMRIQIIFWLSIGLISPFSGANEPELYESHARLQSTVIQFIESNLRHKYPKFDIDVKSIDQRLKLVRCQSALETFSPPGHQEIGAITVGVRCTKPKPWLVYTRAHVRAFAAVVVTRRPLRRGTLITDKDIAVKEIELTRMHRQFFVDPASALGKKLRRSLAAGTVLTANKLSIPKAVKRGEQVIILADGNGMHIRMTGAALADGIAGQKIAVRNTSSNRVVQGTIIGPGMVQVLY